MVIEVLQVMPSFGNAPAGGGNAGGSVKDARQINNLPYYWNTLKEVAKEAATGITTRNGGEITNFSFFGGTFMENYINNHCSDVTKQIIKDLDTSLINSKTTQNTVEKLFDCKFQTNSAGKLVLTASEEALAASPAKLAAGRLVSDVLGTTTKLGLALSATAEAPDLYAAYKNGDFGKQTVRSSTKIAASAVAFGTIAHLAKEFAPAKYKTLAMVFGALVGSTAASKATDSVLNKIMGKSIKTQNDEARKHLAELKLERTNGLV